MSIGILNRIKRRAKRIAYSLVSDGKQRGVVASPSNSASSASTKAEPSKQKELSQGQRAANLFHELFDCVGIVENQVMFDSFWGRSIGCNPYAVYLQMRLDPRFNGFTYIWACNDLSFASDEMKRDPSVVLVAYNSEDYVKGLATSKYLVANANLPFYFVAREDQVYVNVWHGTPLKCIGADTDRRKIAISNTQRNYFQSDVIISYSAAATIRTVDAYHAQDARPRVHEVGTPRIDCTLRSTRDSIRARLGVVGDRPILLYAPTWRGIFGSASADLDGQVSQVKFIQDSFSDKFEIFFSPHHVTAQKLRKDGLNVRFIPSGISINEVLAGTDVLISDYSSIMVDFLILNRPIVLYCYDYNEYKARQGFYFDLQDFPGSFCTNKDGLVQALSELRKPSCFDTFDAFRSELCPLEDGKASERTLSLMLNARAVVRDVCTKKKRIIMFPGGMMTNGVTSSIIALSSQINYEKYDLSVVITASEIDSDEQRQANLARLHPKCRIVYRGDITNYTQEEKAAYSYFSANASYRNPADEDLIKSAFSREARRIFGRQAYDVAVDFSGYGPFWALVMLNGGFARKLIYQHNDMHAEAYNTSDARSFPSMPALFALYRFFDGVISVTEPMLNVNKSKLSMYYRDGAELFAVKNNISGDSIIKRAKTPLGLISPQVAIVRADPGVHMFCCVARLSPEKNHLLLLDAFALALAESPRIALLIVGDGQIRGKLVEHAKRIGISDHVIFLGNLDNPFPILRACDTKVLSSSYEGQGIVLLEAMTLGVSCIATDNPATRSVLEDGYGVIVEPTKEALAKAMICAIRGALPITRKFDWTEYTREAIKAFELAVDGVDAP